MQLSELPLLSTKGMLEFKKHESSRSLVGHQVPSGADQVTHANIFLLYLSEGSQTEVK